MLGAVFLALLFVAPLWVALTSVMSTDGPYATHTSHDNNVIKSVLDDSRNIQSVGRSLGFATIAASSQFCLSLILARLLFHARSSWLLPVCLIPIALPPIATAMMWKALFDFQSGIVNTILTAIGVSAKPWLSTAPLLGSMFSSISVNWAQFSVLLTDTWTWLPFLVGAELLAFARVPRHLLESAAIEGASVGAVFWKIVCPLSRPYLTVLLFIRFLDSFRTFDTVWAFFGRLPAVEHFSARVYAMGYFERDYRASLLLIGIGLLAISPVSAVLLSVSRRVLLRTAGDLDAANS